MQELLKVIVAGLVEDPTAIQITEDAPNEEGVIVYHLHVAPVRNSRTAASFVSEHFYSTSLL